MANTFSSYAWVYSIWRGMVVLDNPVGLESKKSKIKIKHPAMIIGLSLSKWAVSCFLMTTKNKKLQLRSYFIIKGQWVTGIDPWPTDPFPYLHHLHTNISVFGTSIPCHVRVMIPLSILFLPMFYMHGSVVIHKEVLVSRLSGEQRVLRVSVVSLNFMRRPIWSQWVYQMSVSLVGERDRQRLWQGQGITSVLRRPPSQFMRPLVGWLRIWRLANRRNSA